MKAVYINVKTGTASIIEVADSLEAWYSLLDCNLVEMPSRRIGRKRFTVICDEEGLCREDCRISAIDNMGNAMLVGSLLIVAEEPDEDGNTQGLTQEDAEYIMDRVQPMSTRRHPEPYMMLTQCEY